MRVRTGLTDGQNTQVIGPDLKEGMQVIVGTNAATTATATPAAASPFQQQRRGPGPGGF
jgi:HlyD family secretion protein